MNKMAQSILCILMMMPIMSWAHIVFVNKTGGRLLVQLMYPELTRNGIPGSRVFVEQFILFEPLTKQSELGTISLAQPIMIDSVFGSRNRKHTHQYNFITKNFVDRKPKAAAFLVKGFFCNNTECEYGICGIADRTNARCDWIVSPQCMLEEGATYTITLDADAQFLIKKEGGMVSTAGIAPLIKHPFDNTIIIGTYFTLSGNTLN